VSGRVRRQPAGLGQAKVGVAFVAEEDVAAADVFVLVGRVCGVPVVAGEFVVGAGEEVVALGVVLADKQHEGWFGTASAKNGPPSGAARRRRLGPGGPAGASSWRPLGGKLASPLAAAPYHAIYR
jgi:hypothetical protein